MLQDSTSILGGYNQNITDWQAGDDRIFTGTVTGLVAGDNSLTDCYFTLKLNPNDTDANALLQKRITTFLGPAGQITDPTSMSTFTTLLVHIYSADYETRINAGTVYSWDFRVITKGGITWTIASGQVGFQQQVTRTNIAGTPAALPANAQPQIRGFIALNPQQRVGSVGTFNVGDIYFNSNPASGQPVGWQCTQQGSPGTWQAFYVGGTAAPIGGIQPKAPWTFDFQPPPLGSHAIGEIVWNTLPQVGGNAGWICVAVGTPGTFLPFGIISLP